MKRRGNTMRIIFSVIAVILLLSMILSFVITALPQ